MKIKRSLTAGVTSLGLVVGLAGFAGATSGSNDTTGPDSHNSVTSRTNTDLRVDNDNDIKATNSNHQSAYTGEAGTYHNTTGGDASTGSASNSNSLSASLAVDNSGSGSGVMSMPAGSGDFDGSNTNTGPDSHNTVTSTTRTNVNIENDNDLDVYNSNTQTASSGDATVAGNTTGGSAMTGDATNSNSTTINFEVTN
jgi:hypothetical protein